MLISGTSLSTRQTRCGAGLHGNRINMGMNLEKWTSDIQSIVGLFINKATSNTQSIVGLFQTKPTPDTQFWACFLKRQHQTHSVGWVFLNKATPDTVNRGPVPEQGNTMHTVSHLAAPDTQSITGLLLNKATPEKQSSSLHQWSLLPYDESWKNAHGIVCFRSSGKPPMRVRR